MFYKEKIEALERRVRENEKRINSNEVRIDIRQQEIMGLRAMQQRIFNFIGAELKTTPAETELVKKLK